MKNLYIQPETLAFHPKNIQQGTSARLRLPSVSAVRVSALSCPCVPHPTAGSPFSWIAPCALHDSRTATCPTTAVPTCSRAAPASSRHRGRRTASPLSRSRDDITPRKPKTGTCHPCQSKSFTGRGGPGGGGGVGNRGARPPGHGRPRAVDTGGGGAGGGGPFSHPPPPPPRNKPPSAKTTLPLPCPPLRRHLPKRARPGARQPRRGQASATVRAGGP